MNNEIRPTWDAYFLNVAKAIQTRGSCLRGNAGVVIVDKNHRIVGTGYTGFIIVAACGRTLRTCRLMPARQAPSSTATTMLPEERMAIISCGIGGRAAG